MLARTPGHGAVRPSRKRSRPSGLRFALRRRQRGATRCGDRDLRGGELLDDVRKHGVGHQQARARRIGGGRVLIGFGELGALLFAPIGQKGRIVRRIRPQIGSVRTAAAYHCTASALRSRLQSDNAIVGGNQLGWPNPPASSFHKPNACANSPLR